jgi:hypothetical protein
MNRVLFNRLVCIFAFALGFVTLSAAHHPPRMERCASVSFAGNIEKIEWRPPHVQLVIQTDEGMSRRVSWLAINQLSLADIDRDTLHVGDHVSITAGIRLDDVVDRPLLLSYIHRDSDGWGWSQVPLGC